MHFTCLSFTAVDTLIEISFGGRTDAKKRNHQGVEGTEMVNSTLTTKLMVKLVLGTVVFLINYSKNQISVCKTGSKQWE